MSVYSKRFYGPAQPGLTATVLYTVPAGEVIVLRSIQILTNHATTAQTWVVFIFNTALTFELGRWVVPAQSTVNLDLRVPMTAGEELRALRVTSGITGTLTVSGYRFSA